MVIKNNPLSGEERKIVSTRLYKTEFLYFKKACDQEGKTINTKLREMINEEIKRKQSSKIKLLKEKEGIESKATLLHTSKALLKSQIKLEGPYHGL